MTIEVPARTAGMLRRPVVAGAVLLLVYAGLSMFMDPNGYLGTDTGAKVATLEVMSEGNTIDPDVGYWAHELDGEGRLHPLYQAVEREDGGWVAVTTLPMLELAVPLYDLGGYRLALLLPMLGAVATAFAARALARRIGTEADGWSVFWIVGLASPVVVYALDLWEHSIGLACILAAVALLLDVSEGRFRLQAVGAGALFGVGAVLRNETFVYALVAVAAACLALWVRSRSLLRPLTAGAGVVAGFAVPWIANVVLESAAGAPTRATRATGTASAFGSDLETRFEEGLLTFVGANAGGLAESVLIGVAVLAVVLVGFRAEARGDRRFAVVCLLAAACTYLFDALGGLGFISGLLVAFPIAIAGLVQMTRMSRSRPLALVALVALPIVYLFQYTGGAAPQWGGRYTLASAILLGVVGIVGLSARFPTLTRGLVLLSLLATTLGVVWLGVRSRGVEQFFDDVIAQAEPVVISRNAFLIREGGPAVVDRRWLSVADEANFSEAIDVAREVGEERFSVLEWGAEAPPEESVPDDVREVSRSRLMFVDVPVGLVTYEFVG